MLLLKTGALPFEDSGNCHRKFFFKNTPPSRHTEPGTVSLPANSMYISLDFTALRVIGFHGFY